LRIQGTGYLADNKANTSSVPGTAVYCVGGRDRGSFVISGVIMKEMLINKTVEVRR